MLFRSFYRVADALDLQWLRNAIFESAGDDRWEQRAALALADDLAHAHHRLVEIIAAQRGIAAGRLMKALSDQRQLRANCSAKRVVLPKLLEVTKAREKALVFTATQQVADEALRACAPALQSDHLTETNHIFGASLELCTMVTFFFMAQGRIW